MLGQKALLLCLLQQILIIGHKSVRKVFQKHYKKSEYVYKET